MLNPSTRSGRAERPTLVASHSGTQTKFRRSPNRSDFDAELESLILHDVRLIIVSVFSRDSLLLQTNMASGGFRGAKKCHLGLRGI